MHDRAIGPLLVKNLKLVSSAVVGIYFLLSLPAMADWREELGTFRIGVVISGNTGERLAEIEPFRLAMSEKLGITTEILPTRDLSALIRNHAEGRNEYAILSSSAFGAAWALCECVEPLSIAASSDGSTASQSILIARKSGAVTSPQTARGKKILALNENSVLGYSFAVHELQKQKIDLFSGETEFVFFETAEAALTAFASGEGDALIGWQPDTNISITENSRGTLSQLAVLDPALGDNLQIVWTSSPVPHRLHSIRKNLPAEPKQLIRELLGTLFEDDPVAYDAIEPDYAGGFKPAEQSMFDKIAEFAKSPVPGKFIASSRPDTVEDEASGETAAKTENQ